MNALAQEVPPGDPEPDRQSLLAGIERLTALNRELSRRVSELESSNDDVRRSRLATLNMLEDAVASRQLADGLNRQLLLENAERQRAEETLRVSEVRARALIENLPGGAVFILDRDLRYVLADGEALHAVGLTSADLVGRTIAEVPEVWRTAALELPYRRALAGEAFMHEHEIRGRGFLSRGGPLRGDDGRIDAVLAVSFDITARRQAEEDLRESKSHLEEALEAAQAAHQAKDQFMAALSHELRTPLTPILIAATVSAEDGGLPEAVRTQFEMVRNNIRLEAQLIDDLLDQTQIIRGKTRLEKRLVDLHVVLGDALRTTAQEFSKKGIVPVVQLAATDITVEADPMRLQQVFWNILRNAAKFTPEGGSVTIKSASPGDGRVVVVVSDSGLGMTPSEIARVFEPFMQGDHAAPGSTAPFGGLGLGLAISKKLAELHGGLLIAGSPGRGQGTTISLDLPVVSDRAVQCTAELVPGNVTAGKRRALRILVVDDHRSTRAALNHLFCRRGHEVTEAGSVSEGLEKATAGSFDLLVSDLGLPDGTGHDLMRQVRHSRPKMTGIALSGFGMESDIQQAHNAGFSAHLTKPVAVEKLDAILLQIELAGI